MASSTQTTVEIVSSQVTSTLNMSMLNHPLPIKLDRDNHILWHTQMENVIYANGFEDHIEGLRPCPLKTISTGEVNLNFLVWRRYDHMILSWIHSSLNLDVMGQIFGLRTSHEAWTTLQRSFFASTKARTIRAIGELGRKGSNPSITKWTRVEYNPIVASLTARDDDLQLHEVDSILRLMSRGCIFKPWL
ncbi:hypothetical protein AAG906_015467 [Vitis piasezkii]